jgi:hypothetical protein
MTVKSCGALLLAARLWFCAGTGSTHRVAATLPGVVVPPQREAEAGNQARPLAHAGTLRHGGRGA